MASYNNCYGNIVYSRLSRRLRELIMGIAMSGTRVDQRKYRTLLYYDTKDNIAYCVHYEKQSSLFNFELKWLHTI